MSPIHRSVTTKKKLIRVFMEEAGKTDGLGIKPLLRVLSRQREAVPPVWMMRQAGRYLPEYRAVREKAGGFLDLCFNPKLAAEVTLQPVRRFGFDAAILFSDILVIPLALGRKLWFVEGEGPRLEPLADAEALLSVRQEADQKLLAPIYETVRRVKSELGSTTTLIGFCGAAWTVATYMVAGQGTPDQAPAKNMAARAPEAFQYIIDCLVDAGLIDQREPSRRTGSEHEFGPADHMYCGADRRVKPLRMRAETSGPGLVSHLIHCRRLSCSRSAPVSASSTHRERYDRRRAAARGYPPRRSGRWSANIRPPPHGCGSAPAPCDARAATASRSDRN